MQYVRLAQQVEQKQQSIGFVADGPFHALALPTTWSEGIAVQSIPDAGRGVIGVCHLNCDPMLDLDPIQM